MTYLKPMKADLALFPPSPMSFAELACRIKADTALSATRRRDMLSAIKRVSEALGLPLSDIPCQAKWLQLALSKIAPSQIGVSQKTWTNVQSNLRSAMAHVGIVERRQRRVCDLMPEWRVLWDIVHESGDPTVAPAVRRFMFFLNGVGVQPTDVSQAHADEFLLALERNEITKSPQTSWRMATNGWNLAAKRFPAWPRTRLSLPRRAKVIRLPEETFPGSLIAELDKLIAGLAAPDPLADDGALRPRSAATCQQYRQQILRFASELVHSGLEAGQITGLAALIQPSVAERGLRQMLARNGNRTNRAIADMAGLLRNLGRMLHVPTEQGDALKLLARKLAMAPQKGMTEKNRARLRVLQDPAQQRRLLNLPSAVFERPICKNRRTSDLLAREDALAIALLLVCPLRIKNVAAIDVHKHIQRPGDGRVFLVIEDAETKNGQPIEFELPAEVVALIDAHLATRAPELCAPGTRFLFPQRRRTASIDPRCLSTRISKRLRKELGIKMNAHLFRHFAVMLWLDANPGGYEVARRLLGHKQLSHTINMYAGMEAKSATRAFNDLLDSLRKPG